MLTSLLPGFREIRAPLAAGSLILASAYVLTYTFFERATEQDGDVAVGFMSLSDELGVHGWLIVAAVAAYLLGSLYVAVTSWRAQFSADRWVRRALNDSQLLLTGELAGPRPFTLLALQRLVYLTEHAPGSRIEDPKLSAAKLCWNIVQDPFGTRLVAANKDLFNEYDRLKSEAEFREAIALPLVIAGSVVVISLDIRLGPSLALIGGSVVIAVTLSSMARRLRRQARSLYAHAVANRLVKATAAGSESS